MRCNICNVEAEADAKYCRRCGRPIHNSPKSSADNLAAEHNRPDETSRPNSTSVIGPDFSNQGQPKKVVPLSKKDGSSTASRRRRLRKLQVRLFPVIALLLVLQLAATGVIFTWIVKHKTAPSSAQPAQAQSPASDRSVQTPSEQTDAKEIPSNASMETTATLPATEDASARLDAGIDEKQRISDKLDADNAAKQHLGDELDARNAEKQRQLKSLEQQYALVKGEVDNLIAERTALVATINKLEGQIAYAKSTARKSQKELARLRWQKQEATARLKGINQVISRRQLVARNLQKRIDLMTYANHGSRKPRVFRKR